jgi:hypothetical protein
MQIGKSHTIAGIPLVQVRDFFGFMLRRHHSHFDITSLRKRLRLSEGGATELVLELQSREYVKELKNGSYEFTGKAHALAMASAASRIKRTTAEATLAGILQRVGQYNADENKLLTIDIVVVFGSFIGTIEELGDLDIAVKHSFRDPDSYPEKVIDYSRRSNRVFDTFYDRLYWPARELDLILKARKRTIRMQSWDSFLSIAVNNRDHFDYRVVYGSPEQVNAELQAQADFANKTESAA